MDAQQETWATLPIEGYEISTLARVRSWRPAGGPGKRTLRSEPKILRGRTWGGRQFYNLAGIDYSVSELLEMAYGEDAALDMEEDRERMLSRYELSEIRDAEGFKDAQEVALEFRILPDRVRRVWDGEE